MADFKNRAEYDLVLRDLRGERGDILTIDDDLRLHHIRAARERLERMIATLRRIEAEHCTPDGKLSPAPKASGS